MSYDSTPTCGSAWGRAWLQRRRTLRTWSRGTCVGKNVIVSVTRVSVGRQVLRLVLVSYALENVMVTVNIKHNGDEALAQRKAQRFANAYILLLALCSCTQERRAGDLRVTCAAHRVSLVQTLCKHSVHARKSGVRAIYVSLVLPIAYHSCKPCASTLFMHARAACGRSTCHLCCPSRITRANLVQALCSCTQERRAGDLRVTRTAHRVSLVLSVLVNKQCVLDPHAYPLHAALSSLGPSLNHPHVMIPA
jgi:hypothetical protein